MALGLAFLATQATAAGIDEDAGRTGFGIVKLAPGPRARTLGDASVAVGGDEGAAHFNPATLWAGASREVSLAHLEWFEGVRCESVAAAWRSKRSALGLAGTFGSVTGIERRTGPSAEPLGTFGVYDVIVRATFARVFRGHIIVGMSVKALYEKIDIRSASAGAVDVGLLVERRFGSGMARLGLAVRQLGRSGRMAAERVDLPTDFLLGAAYELEREGSASGLVLAGAVRVPNDKGPEMTVSTEYRMWDALALRAGFCSGSETVRMRYGVGVRRGLWGLDYALVPLRLGLGAAHHVALKFSALSASVPVAP